MRCVKCKVEAPYLESLGTTYDCIYCGGAQRPTAADFLTEPSLHLAREVRPAQIEMAKLVDQAFLGEKVVVIEAGTGVGKSFAYLLPAILSGKRVVISTAKKSLQNQLIEKDLPLLKEKLGSIASFDFAPAYGKGNYGCRRITRKNVKSASLKKDWDVFFANSPTWHWDEMGPALLKGSKSGKLPVLKSSHANSAEHCVGTLCAEYSDCHYMAERKRMLQSQIVVANHWLVGFHLRLERELDSFQLLGAMDYLFVDEAHKFEDGIRAAFTYEIRDTALRTIMDAYETYAVTRSGASVHEEIPNSKPLKSTWAALFKKVAPAADKDAGTVSTLGVEGTMLSKYVGTAITALTDPTHVNDFLGGGVQGAPLLSNLMRKVAAPADLKVKVFAALTPDELTAHGMLSTTVRKLQDIHNTLLLSYDTNGADNRVTYIEQLRQYCAIRVAPIDIAPYMATAHDRLTSVLYTSATLAINGTMDVFKNRTGVNRYKAADVISSQFGSAFDMNTQALMYIAKDMLVATRSEDKVEDYREALANEISDLVSANQGNAFVLFTARDEMRDTYERLKTTLPCPIVIQDGVTAAQALQQYRHTDNAVLFGLKSFWEGVDVEGDKLSLVILAKLPFPGTGDPIITARKKKAGNRSFHAVDLPDMTLDLRQGAGRLIRSKTDRGVIALLDPRVLTKRYGKSVLNSLGVKRPTTSKEATLNALRNLAKHRQARLIAEKN